MTLQLFSVPTSLSAPVTSAARSPAAGDPTIIPRPLTRRIFGNTHRNRKLTRTEEFRVKYFIRTESSTLPKEDGKKVSGGRLNLVCTSLTKSARPICGEIVTTIVLLAPSTKTGKALLLKTGHFTQAAKRLPLSLFFLPIPRRLCSVG